MLPEFSSFTWEGALLGGGGALVAGGTGGAGGRGAALDVATVTTVSGGGGGNGGGGGSENWTSMDVMDERQGEGEGAVQGSGSGGRPGGGAVGAVSAVGSEPSFMSQQDMHHCPASSTLCFFSAYAVAHRWCISSVPHTEHGSGLRALAAQSGRHSDP